MHRHKRAHNYSRYCARLAISSLHDGSQHVCSYVLFSLLSSDINQPCMSKEAAFTTV